ncbi:unnamed protein product [Arabis nemorensis]|uniref:Uncharacterized protein n=1 Tax=Arabis nemorensis TaxID=586526 RepID=A0A565CK24_9BRAS|nr:unnamed protein product [Arabis nemorensis]
MNEEERLCFGLFIEQVDVSQGEHMYYEFAAQSRPTEDFVERHKGTTMTLGGDAVGCTDLLAMSWTSLMSEDCLYFIDDVLHLWVDIFYPLLEISSLDVVYKIITLFFLCRLGL